MSVFASLLGRIVSPNAKAFKVQDIDRKRRVGIVAKSHKELVGKVASKFKIESENLTLVLEEDGMEVEDDKYLQKLPDHMVLVALRPGEKWSGKSSLLEELFEKLQNANYYKEVRQQIQDLMSSGDSSEKLELMAAFCNLAERNIEANSRKEHPEWFDGLDTSYKTKEAYLRNSAKSRIRSYLDIATKYINQRAKGKNKEALQEVLESFRNELDFNAYYQDYFCRSCKDDKIRWCNREGMFLCEGEFDAARCERDHLINPYGSSQDRKVFSTWNLDHMIEKSRQILPSLLQAAQEKNDSQDINVQYFYDLLFTKVNLRLVHIACHDKSNHDGYQCDPDKFYLK